MGDDLFPGGPGLAIDVKAGIELDSGAFRNGRRIAGPAVGMRGRTGNVARPGVGTGEEECVIDAPLRDLLRSDDAAERGEPGGDRAKAVLAQRALRAPAVGGGDVATARRP